MNGVSSYSTITSGAIFNTTAAAVDSTVTNPTKREVGGGSVNLNPPTITTQYRNGSGPLAPLLCGLAIDCHGPPGSARTEHLFPDSD